MTQLSAARRDLAAAGRHLENMRSAKNLDEIEAAWRAFLHDSHKLWTKVELACKNHPKAQPWFGTHIRARRKDMLLRYLHHARNAEEHTLTEIVSREPGGFAIKALPGQSAVFIKSLKIQSGPSGMHIDYEGSPVQFEVTQPRVKLERVFDSGDWYNPPTRHLERPLSAIDPIAVATLGLEYCERLVDEASVFFPPPA